MAKKASTPLATRTGKGPTSRVEITAAGVAKIERLAALGHGQASIGKALGIGQATLMRAMERQPEVAEAFATGRSALGDEIASGLLAQFRKGNTTAGIFLAKWMLDARDSGPAQNSKPTVAIQINLPAPKSVEDYMRAITATVKEAG